MSSTYQVSLEMKFDTGTIKRTVTVEAKSREEAWDKAVEEIRKEMIDKSNKK